MAGNVKGVEQLRQLGKGLEAFNDRKFKASVSRRITKVVKPAAEPAAKERAREILPKRGGLNHLVDDAKVTVRTRTVGRSVGVSVTMRQTRGSDGKQRDLVHLDEGRLRRPVFARGDRKFWTWRDQPVRAGFFSDPMTALADPIGKELLGVIDDVMGEIDSHLKH